MKDVREALMSGLNSEGKRVARPLSPHLQIYRPQITSALSIFHRMTGFVMAAGAGLLAWWLVSVAYGPGAFATVQWFFSTVIGFILLILWSGCLFYHLFNGMRHLHWDAGAGFEKSAIHKSGVFVLGATGTCTLVMWLLIFFVVR